MKEYQVLISAMAFYVVEAENEEQAQELAWKQFEDDPSDLINSAEADQAEEL